jgi:hypothetical protein
VSRYETEPALLALVRDTIDDLGSLVTSHFRLARAELGRDVKTYGRRAVLVAVAAASSLLGYGLACVAAALALARVVPAPLAFLAVGGFHLVGGGAFILVLLHRAPPRPLDETFAELDRTVATLAPVRKQANGHA